MLEDPPLIRPRLRMRACKHARQRALQCSTTQRQHTPCPPPTKVAAHMRLPGGMDGGWRVPGGMDGVGVCRVGWMAVGVYWLLAIEEPSSELRVLHESWLQLLGLQRCVVSKERGYN